MGGKLRVIKEHFELLFQQGIVRPSSNQWANPLHMVPKLKDDWRATGHFRKLNAETTLDRYPILLIKDISHHLHGKNISMLDLELDSRYR